MAQDYTGGLKKSIASYLDWTTVFITIMLIAFGLISIYSATYDSKMSSYFDRQLLSSGIGLVIMLVVMYIPERWLSSNSYLIYAACIGLLISVLFIGIESHGTKGWIRLGSFTVQPSEVAKLGLILAIAKYLSVKGNDIRTIRDVSIVIALTLIPFVLIIRQPDMGSATVLIALLFGVLFWSGFDLFILYFFVALPVIVLMALKGKVYFISAVTMLSGISFIFRRKIVLTIIAISIFITVGAIAPLFYENLQPHQKARIETFLNPGSNPLGSGYNVMQSKLAIGSGGVYGKGFLKGTQTQLRYIPMQWTDFIYSVPNEEFGFVGGVSIILLYLALIYRAIKIANEVESKFHSVLAIGAASVFLYHFFINIGMTIGLIPVMGIPLPFMSSGGSSMILNLTLVGLLLNANRHYKLNR